MSQSLPRCLILACGNTLRSDDGVGPWLADWAEQHFCNRPEIRILSRQQWTPDLAEDIAQAESVLFIDCSIESPPGSVHVIEVHPDSGTEGLATHHQGAPQLLALARELYNSLPRQAMLLTVGAGSTELGEEFSGPVTAALPAACKLLEDTVLRLLATPN
jgi:hydrogenase maturation protease